MMQGGSGTPVGAVTHRMGRGALIKKCVVLLRNAWWVTQKTLTHSTFLDSRFRGNDRLDQRFLKQDKCGDLRVADFFVILSPGAHGAPYFVSTNGHPENSK